eukprot:7232000-Pyramimonas_sp.AAC.1
MCRFALGRVRPEVQAQPSLPLPTRRPPGSRVQRARGQRGVQEVWGVIICPVDVEGKARGRQVYFKRALRARVRRVRRAVSACVFRDASCVE